MKGAMGNMMKQAQKMQEDMQKAQQENRQYGSRRAGRWWYGEGINEWSP